MTDKEEPKTDKKSIAELKVIPGNAESTAKKKQEKRKYRDIHYQVASAMAGRPLGWHPFPMKLHRMVDVRGENLAYVEDDKKLVREVSNAFLNSAVAHYWDQILTHGDRPIYLGAISAGDCDKIRSLWYALSPAIKSPFPLVTWASDPRPAHHKIEFDPFPVSDLGEAAPLFHEMMSRTTNAAALMVFIGSIFDEQSYRQQYSWIYGGGRNGKGALIRCLGDLLAPVHGSEETPSGDAKHWTWGLLGKRLVVFADCNNASFVTSGRFKSLTGDDKIRVEIKRGAILSLDIPAKYMFTSNARPKIQSTTADMRRIIYSYIAPVPKENEVDNYEECLQAEFPAFISHCWNRYQEAIQGNPKRKIEVSNIEEVEDLARDSEHEYEAFADGRLNVISYPDSTPFNLRAYIRPERMKEIMIHSGFKTAYEREGLRKYLERVHGIVCKTINIEKKRFPAFINCSEFPVKDS